MSQREPFVVRHYTDEEGPVIKGNGFDGLRVGDTRAEAEEFVEWIERAIADAVSAERERCIKAVQDSYNIYDPDYADIAACVEAIRKG